MSLNRLSLMTSLIPTNHLAPLPSQQLHILPSLPQSSQASSSIVPRRHCGQGHQETFMLPKAKITSWHIHLPQREPRRPHPSFLNCSLLLVSWSLRCLPCPPISQVPHSQTPLGLLPFFPASTDWDTRGPRIQYQGFKFCMDPKNSKISISNLDISTDLQTYTANCLLTISTWMSKRSLYLNLSKRKLHFPLQTLLLQCSLSQ